MKKVVFVGFLLGFGGAERSMIMLANALSKFGHSVSILTLKEKKIVYEIDENIKHFFIPDEGKTKMEVSLKRFLNVKKILKKIKPDLVVSFWLQPVIFAVLLSKYIGFKTVYSERGDPSDNEYKGLLGILRNVFFRFIDGFVFQTKSAKNYFSNKIQEKSIVIPNPIYFKYEDYQLPKKRRNVIVNVGRLHEQKNQELLINAFSKISKEFPEYSLDIYGEGNLKFSLEKQIEDLGLNEKVHLKGTRKELFSEIIDTAMFILTSDYEGMPNALMEAMALGLPCISTDCKPGGARELIEQGKNGILCRRDSCEDLVKGIKYLILNPENAEKLGKEAKEICVTHNQLCIFRQWDLYFMELLGNKE